MQPVYPPGYIPQRPAMAGNASFYPSVAMPTPPGYPQMSTQHPVSHGIYPQMIQPMGYPPQIAVPALIPTGMPSVTVGTICLMNGLIIGIFFICIHTKADISKMRIY